MITDFLICPKTRQQLMVDWERNVVTTADGKISYPIVDGIIDFVLDSSPVSEVYDSVSSYYDSGLTRATSLTRLYNKVVWDCMTYNMLKSFVIISKN